MKIFKILFLSILFIGLNSCSSSDDSGETGGTTSITLTPSTTTQMVGEQITFVVKDDKGEDVTLNTALTVGNTAVSNATFTSQTAGDFTVLATYQGVTATVTVTFTDIPTTSIILTADMTTQSAGDNIKFTVKTNTGINVTSSAVITTGETTISNGTFTSSTAGTFEVSASYLTFTSETVSVTFTPAINFTKRVLIEDYTGAWCGWCPRVSYAIELVQEQTDKAVVVALHNGTTNPGNGYDPYNFNVGALGNLINLSGYPTAKLNRMTTWGSPEPTKVSQVIALTEGSKPKVGLAMKSTVSGGNINLEVKTKFGKDYTTATKLVVYISENGLILDQVNYTDYYGGADIISNFEHNHVLRACLTNLLGDAFSTSETVFDNEVTKTFNIPVPANVENVNNIEFVAFVVGADNKAINVRKALPNEEQTLEIIE